MTLPNDNPITLKNNKKKLLIYSLIGLGIILIVICLFVFRPQLGKLFNKGCSPSLAIGDSIYGFKMLTPKSDGTLNLPGTHPELAYWIAGTTTNNVFVLISSPENQSLISGLSEKDNAIVTWANCNSTTYTLTTPTRGNLMDAVKDQSISQLTLVMPTDDALNGPMVIGNLQGETITSFSTPDASSAQMEVSILDKVISNDQKLITFKVSLNNYGEMPIAISAKDISLIPEGQEPFSLIKSDPTLPVEIKPGKTANFQFTFQNHSDQFYTLKILGLEYGF